MYISNYIICIYITEHYYFFNEKMSSILSPSYSTFIVHLVHCCNLWQSIYWTIPQLSPWYSLTSVMTSNLFLISFEKRLYFIYIFLFYFIKFETGSHVPQTGFEISVWTGLTSIPSFPDFSTQYTQQESIFLDYIFVFIQTLSFYFIWHNTFLFHVCCHNAITSVFN